MQRAGQAAGFAAATIAAAALIGWWAGLPLLASWGAGFAAVKPVTASCLAALGLALVYPGKDWRFAFAVGLAVAALAALALAEVLFNVELGIGPLVVAGGASFRETATTFRVTNAAVLAGGLAGGALALGRFERHRLA